MVYRSLSASAIGLFLLGLPTVSGASCISSGIENNVFANAGCELGTENNDFLSSPLQVNKDAMFGFTDWVFAEKFEFNSVEENIDVGLLLTGGDQSGAWSINDVWSNYSHIMLVFKSRESVIQPNVIQPNTYVGYSLVNGDISGSYASPFTNSLNGNPTAVSHVSAYVRLVPEPSSMALVGFLLGMVALCRRR